MAAALSLRRCLRVSLIIAGLATGLAASVRGDSIDANGGIVDALRSAGLSSYQPVVNIGQVAPQIYLAVPQVYQTTPYTCGAASTAAVLNAFGFLDANETNMSAEMGTTPEMGTRATAIAAACQRRGLYVDARPSMDIDDLQGALAVGRLVIVSYQAWIDPAPGYDWAQRWQDGHYSVVIGLNATHVLLMDPSQNIGSYGAVPYREFLRRWHDYDGDPWDGTLLLQLGIVIGGPPIQRLAALPGLIEYTA